jgi:general secretion pathway protein B
MSLILEALRRSEAERRRGAPPGLLDPGEPLRRPRASPWPMALAGLLGGALIASAAAWWWSRTPDASVASRAPAPVAAPNSTPPHTPPPWVAAERQQIPAAAYATAPERPTVDVAPAPRPAAAPQPAPEAPDDARGPRAGDLPLGDLVGSARGSLPPLRLSMHVYADDPARRFAIVDGQRLREGDPIGTGVQLLEIRRDGLRVAWQGRTLWVPR